MSEDKHLIWLIWIFFLLALQLIYSFTFRVLWLMQLESAHYNQGKLGRSKTTNMFLITLLTNFRMTVFFSKISAENKTLWRFEGACQVTRFDLSVWASWIIGRKIVRLEIGRDGQKSYPAALDMWTVSCGPSLTGEGSDIFWSYRLYVTECWHRFHVWRNPVSLERELETLPHALLSVFIANY